MDHSFIYLHEFNRIVIVVVGECSYFQNLSIFRFALKGFRIFKIKMKEQVAMLECRAFLNFNMSSSEVDASSLNYFLTA